MTTMSPHCGRHLSGPLKKIIISNSEHVFKYFCYITAKNIEENVIDRYEKTGKNVRKNAHNTEREIRVSSRGKGYQSFT